jgi:molybdopterin synthase catalytic subunit
VRSLRVAPGLQPQDALSWLSLEPAGALAFVVTAAKDGGLRADPSPEAEAILSRALDHAEAAGATRVLAWHAQGVVPLGGPVAIVGACAAHRKDALRAVDLLLAGLKGAAARTDLAGPQP